MGGPLGALRAGAVAVAALAIAANGAWAGSDTTPRRTPDRGSGASAVVAIMDSGINPYHTTFQDDSPLARKHPSTYISGYPKDAIALRLSLDEETYWEAVKKDCERVWDKIEPGKLYWFPGTKIIGAVTFSPQIEIDCKEAKPSENVDGRIIDAGGHGTMTASRAASNEYGACTECRIVAVQFSLSGFNKDDAIDAIRWGAKNSDWIDLQSNSWGPIAPLWEPTGQGQLMTANPQLVRAVEDVSRRHLAFWASGNGALFRWGALGHPTPITPHLTPSAIMVGGHDSGYVASWPGFPPHIVSDACNCWAAYHQEKAKSAATVGSGTSSATPFAAGGAARILLEARRILDDPSTGVSGGVVARGRKGVVARGPLADGKLTLEEWKRLVFVSATPRPKAQREDGPPCGVVDGLVLYSATPVKWSDVPPQYPEYLHIGYGAVDHPAVARAVKILEGTIQPPDRSATDAYFERDRSIRETTYGAWSRP
ncbi:MAG: S8 family serine peptidase [Actinomycetota bacterium]